MQEARAQALVLLGDIAKTEMPNDDRSASRIFIRDDGGKVLLTVSVFVQDY